MTSPTARTLALLRKWGYTAQVVEKWVPQARRRVDLFGFGDVLAIRPGATLLVQATSASNVSARIAKIRAHENLPVVLAAGWQVLVVGWRKSKRTKRWVHRVEVIGTSEGAG